MTRIEEWMLAAIIALTILFGWYAVSQGMTDEEMMTKASECENKGMAWEQIFAGRLQQVRCRMPRHD